MALANSGTMPRKGIITQKRHLRNLQEQDHDALRGRAGDARRAAARSEPWYGGTWGGEPARSLCNNFLILLFIIL